MHPCRRVRHPPIRAVSAAMHHSISNVRSMLRNICRGAFGIIHAHSATWPSVRLGGTASSGRTGSISGGGIGSRLFAPCPLSRRTMQSDEFGRRRLSASGHWDLTPKNIIRNSRLHV